MKSNRASSSDVISNQTIESLREFLESAGWEMSERENGILFVSRPDNKDVRLRYLLPLEQSSDFEFYVSNLLKGAAIVNGTTFDETVRQLQEFSRDQTVAKQTTFRIKIGRESKHSLELSEAELLLHHARLALAHSWGCEEADYYDYKKRPSPTASEASQHFEFAQTQQGSFVIVIRASRSTVEQMSFKTVPAVTDPQARSILRIARGLDWLSHHSVPTTYEDAFGKAKDGLNASMAQHLIKISDAVNGQQCELFFEFNRDITSQLRPENVRFSLSPKLVSRLTDLYRVLTQSEEEALTLNAKVIGLDSRNPQQAKLKHRITIEIVRPAGDFEIKNRRLTIAVDQTQYQRAWRAHGAGKLIRIAGLFKRVGKGLECQEVLSLHQVRS